MQFENLQHIYILEKINNINNNIHKYKITYFNNNDIYTSLYFGNRSIKNYLEYKNEEDNNNNILHYINIEKMKNPHYADFWNRWLLFNKNIDSIEEGITSIENSFNIKVIKSNF